MTSDTTDNFGITSKTSANLPTFKAVMPNFSASTDKEIKHAASKRRVGRRGDPRMHLAVRARLSDPHMTMLDALLVGGFTFPNAEVPGLSDRQIKDTDNVSLCQRKNQLMRRLRTANNDNISSMVDSRRNSISTSSLRTAGTQGSSPIKGVSSSPRGYRSAPSMGHASSLSTGHRMSDKQNESWFMEASPSFLQGHEPVSDQCSMLHASIQQQSTAPASVSTFSPGAGASNGSSLQIFNDTIKPSETTSTPSLDHSFQPFIQLDPSMDLRLVPSVKQVTKSSLMTGPSKVVSVDPPTSSSSTKTSDESSNNAALEAEMEQSLQNFIDFFMQSAH